jgi:hypothetical protein
MSTGALATQPRASSFVSALLSLLLAASCAGEPAGPEETPGVVTVAPEIQTRVIDLGPLRIDGLYRSMDGPMERVEFDATGIDWVTRFRTEVISADTLEPLGDAFFCHSQLQLGNLTRLMVTASGIDEVRFPDGFGLPLATILRDVPLQWRDLSLLGMVLNNHDPEMLQDVMVRVTLDYASDPPFGSGRTTGLKKLFKVGIPTTLERARVFEGDPPQPATVELYKGLRGHWMVPPGQQIIRERHTGLVPVPSTVHYALVHLHNHGRRMKLTDVTEGRELWRSEVIYEEGTGRTQIVEITGYSDDEGFRLYPDHEYEVESTYFNESDTPVDAMAVMYLYYHPDGDLDISYPDPPPTMKATDHSGGHG